VALISIVIPTHNRQIYAAASVRKIVDVLPSAQIVVSDTSADDRLGSMLPVASGGQDIKYVRPDRPMDVVSHFEFALSHANGRFVLFLGDDDCVGPGLEKVALWAEQNDVDTVFSYGNSFIANYFWPGVKSRFYGDKYASSLFVHGFTGQARRVDAIAELNQALHNIGSGLGNMPRIYHGLISRDLIDRIRERFGTLFGGVTPDISSAALISAMARNAWQVDYPICLPGGSPSSTAGTGAAGTDMTSLRQHPHTAAFGDLRWDPMIPAYYAPYIVWAYSLKKTVDQLGSPDLKPNLARLYAISLMRNREQRPKIMESFKNAQKLGVSSTDIGGEIVREMAFQGKRLLTRLASPGAGGKAKHYTGLQDIGASYDQLEKHIKQHGIKLDLPSLR
jgi:hypothetical protein